LTSSLRNWKTTDWDPTPVFLGTLGGVLAVLGTGLASAQCSTAAGREAQGVRFAVPFAERQLVISGCPRPPH